MYTLEGIRVCLTKYSDTIVVSWINRAGLKLSQIVKYILVFFHGYIDGVFL